MTLCFFLIGDFLTFSYAHEALSDRISVLGSGVSKGLVTSSDSETYRLFLRPATLSLETIDENLKAFFVVDPLQFIRKSGIWQSQLTIDPAPYQLWSTSDPVALELHQQLLQIGDVIVVETGQRIPVDGILLEQTVRLSQHHFAKHPLTHFQIMKLFIFRS